MIYFLKEFNLWESNNSLIPLDFVDTFDTTYLLYTNHIVFLYCIISSLLMIYTKSNRTIQLQKSDLELLSALALSRKPTFRTTRVIYHAYSHTTKWMVVKAMPLCSEIQFLLQMQSCNDIFCAGTRWLASAKHHDQVLIAWKTSLQCWKVQHYVQPGNAPIRM